MRYEHFPWKDWLNIPNLLEKSWGLSWIRQRAWRWRWVTWNVFRLFPIQCWREMNIASAAAYCKPYLQGARLSDPLLHLLARLHVLCLDLSSSNTGMGFSTLSLRPVLLPMRRVQSLTLAFFQWNHNHFDQFFHFIQIPSLNMLLHPVEPDLSVPRSRKNVMPEGKKAIKDGLWLLISDIASLLPVGMHIRPVISYYILYN